MNRTHRLLRTVFFVLVVIIGIAIFAHAGNPVSDMVFEKAKDELVERLNDRGFTNTAYVVGNMDPSKWGEYAMQLRAGEYDKVIAELLEEQKQAVMTDLYEKAKGYAKEFASDKLGLSGETLKYLGYVEKNKDSLTKMLAHTWNGNYSKAGDVFLETIKKELKGDLEAKAKEICYEFMDEAMKEIMGDLIPFGAIYRKIVELEMWAIEAFDKKVNLYYESFQIFRQSTGEHKTRTICEQYRINRGDMGWDPLESLTLNPKGEQGGPSSLEDVLIAAGYAKATGWDWEKTASALEIVCYIRHKLKGYEFIKVIEHGKWNGKQLFIEIKEGMARGRGELRTILTDIRISNVFDLVVTVIDGKSGEKVSNASVTLNGETKETPSGVAQFRRGYQELDTGGRTWSTIGSFQISASARDYEPKTAQFTPEELQKKFDMKTNRIEIRIPLDRLKKAPSPFELMVRVVDLKTGSAIMNATVSVDDEKKGALNGEASFQRDGELLEPDKSQQEIKISAAAEGYESKTVIFSAGLLAKKFDNKLNQVRIIVALEKKKEIKKSLELLVSVIDSTSKKSVANAFVSVDGEKKPAPLSSVSFQRDTSMLLPENSDKTIRIEANAAGYDKKVLLLKMGYLASQVDNAKNLIKVSVPLDPQVKQGFTKLEVRCEPAEIFEDQTSVCKAIVYDSLSRGTHVNTRVAWSYRPDYGPFVPNGIIRGEEVKKNIGKLPRLIEVRCSIQVTPDEGGQTLSGKGSVLVKPFKEQVIPRINIEKSANPIQIYIGDTVTYGYVVTNTGNCPVQDVKTSDDKCGPIRFVSGDDNNDQKLDVGERWTYRCVLKDVKGPSGTLTNKGSVEGKDPSGRTTVRASADAQISVLRKKVRVPNVVGMIQNDASQEISKASLKVGPVSQERSYLAVGLICRQSPEAETYVDAGTSVNLWITEDEPKYIYVDPPRKTLQLRERVSFDATLITKNGSQKPLNVQSKVRWDPGPSNTFTCEKPGKFLVWADYKGVSGSATVTCEEDWSVPVFEPPISNAGDRNAKVPTAGPGDYTWYAFCNMKTGEVTYGQQLPFGQKIMAGPFPGPRTVDDWIKKNCSTWRCDTNGVCALKPAMGGQWKVLCGKNDLRVVLSQTHDPLKHMLVKEGFLGEPDARAWANQMYPNWSCTQTGASVPRSSASAPRRGGRWAVVCNKGTGTVSLTEYPNVVRDWIWSDGLFGEPDARAWANQNCPSWRCDAQGRCLTGVTRREPEGRPLDLPPEPERSSSDFWNRFSKGFEKGVQDSARTKESRTVTDPKPEPRSAPSRDKDFWDSGTSPTKSSEKTPPAPKATPSVAKEWLSDAEAKALQKELWDRYNKRWNDEWCLHRPERNKRAGKGGRVNWSGCAEEPLRILKIITDRAWWARSREKQSITRSLAACYDPCVMRDISAQDREKCYKDCNNKNPVPK